MPGKPRYKDFWGALSFTKGAYTTQQVAHHLISNEVSGWGDKTLDSAERKVRDCFNPNRDELFKISELIEIMQFTQCFDVMYFICDTLGLSRPDIIPTESRVMAMADHIIQAETFLSTISQDFHQLVKHLEQNSTPQPQDKLVRFSQQETKRPF